MYIHKLNDIVDKYNNTYQSNVTIKLKLVDFKVDTCFDYRVECNDKNPKFKVSVHVRISKYKNLFCKGLHCKLI